MEADEEVAAAAAAVAVENEDLALVVAIDAARPVRKYGQRSWQLLEKARAAKRQKAVQEAMGAEAKARAKAEAALSLAHAVHPVIMSGLGVSPPGSSLGGAPMDEHKASLLQVVALQPPIHSKGYGPTVKSQRRAVGAIVRTLCNKMVEYTDGLFEGIFYDGAGNSDAIGCHARMDIKSLSWQWDETAQRCKQILQQQSRIAGVRASRERTSVQVMMQSGRVRVHSGTSGDVMSSEGIFCRASFLPTTAANNLLASFLPNYPLALEDDHLLLRVSQRTAFLVLQFAHDRASSNYAMLKYLWQRLVRPSVPVNIAPYSEACFLHGFALCKTRPSFGRDLVKSGFSLTRLLRNWRDLQAWRLELLTLVSSNMKVCRAQMPATSRAFNSAVQGALFGPDDSKWLWVTTKDGHLQKSQLLCDVEAVVQHLELGKPLEELTHWCWVEENSLEHLELGKAPGSACCKSREESLDKMMTVLLNYLVARAWVVGAENRWTDSTNILKRVFFGFAMHELVPKSLGSMQTHWGLSPDDAGLEAELDALVRQDTQNWDARRKLRLVRICRTMCRPSTHSEMAILLTGTGVVDGLIYKVFGHDKSKKATAHDLVGWSDPMLAQAQTKFHSMLSSWSDGAEAWALFKVARGDWGSTVARGQARGHLLQLSASLFEHFEMSMREPPYSLVVLFDADAPQRIKRERAVALLSKPLHCLSLFLRRLRGECPRVRDLLGKGARIIKAWNDSNELSIHFSERSHGAFRLDVRSCGPGKNATVSANRILVQQAAAEHTARFKTPPCPAAPLAASASGCGGAERSHRGAPSQKQGGSPWIAFYNSKEQAAKRAIAPDRPLTAPERTSVCEAALAEWRSLSEEEREKWDWVYRWGVAARRLSQGAAPHALAAPDAGARNLWAPEGRDETSLVAAKDVVAEHQRYTWAQREKLSVHDPALVGPESPPNRIAEVFADDSGDRVAPVLSCWQLKKNVCRHCISDELCAAMEDLTSLLNSWVTSLGKEAANSASALFSLHGSRPAVGGAIEDEEVDLCAMLVLPRGVPRMQTLARCCLEGCSDQLQRKLPEPPFVVELCASASRLQPTFQRMMWQTSDELCLEAATLGMAEWILVPLAWEEMPARPTLLPLHVVGKARFAKPARQARKPRQAATAEWAALDAIADDPVVVGRAAGSAPSLATTAAPDADPTDSAEAEGAEDDADHDLVGFDLDFASDVDDLLRDDLYAGAEADKDLGEAMAAETCVEREDAGLDEDEGAMDDVVPAPEAEAPPVPPPVEALPLPMHEVDREGYVVCKEDPWSFWPHVGRITSWQAKKKGRCLSLSGLQVRHARQLRHACSRAAACDRRVFGEMAL